MSDSAIHREHARPTCASGGGFAGGPCRVAGSARVFDQRACSTVSSAERYDLPLTSVSAPYDAIEASGAYAEGDSNRSTAAGSQSCRAHPFHRPHSSRASSSACIALIALRNTSRANEFPATASPPAAPLVAGFLTPAPVRAGASFRELLLRTCCTHQRRFVAAQYGQTARVVSITA
jgi:hypothetical protein